jgi:hypothetical protein
MTPTPLCSPDGVCHAYLCPSCGEVKGWGATWMGRPFSTKEPVPVRARLNLAYAYLAAVECAKYCHSWKVA